MILSLSSVPSGEQEEVGLMKEGEMGVGQEQPGELQHCSSPWPGRRWVVEGACEMDERACSGFGRLVEVAREAGASTLYCLDSLGETGEQD